MAAWARNRLPHPAGATALVRRAQARKSAAQETWFEAWLVPVPLPRTDLTVPFWGGLTRPPVNCCPVPTAATNSLAVHQAMFFGAAGTPATTA